MTAQRLPLESNARLETPQVLVAAKLREGVGRRVEDRDAVIGRDVDLVRLGINGQGQRDAFAELIDDRAGGRVELQERPAAGRRPEIPSLSNARAKIWYGSVASGVPICPPFRRHETARCATRRR